ncbi:MAG: hypothetical protein J6T14_02450 [Clostridia bacterium]|nr:hypothetical protein [Clostridia bacterium]MBP5273108.1 hypothetical protein [Clostridia bacterium]
MRMTKKLVAVLMTLLMVLICCIPAFAKAPKYDNYAVLGDSIPTGYMLPGYKYAGRKTVLWPVVPNSYPTFVAKGVGAKNTYMLAHSGYRTADLRRVLDPDFAGDYFNARRLPKLADTYAVDQAGLEKLRKGVIKYLKKSDLITLQIGANDSFQVIVILFEMLRENQELLAELQASGALDPNVTTKMLEKLAQDNETLLRIIEMELASVQGFRNNFDVIIKKIHEINPNAKVVVLGLYNPLECFNIAGISPAPLIQPLIQGFNSYMQSGSQYSKYYTYCPLTNIENYMGTLQLFANPELPGDVHPTPKGHQQIAEQILAVL